METQGPLYTCMKDIGEKMTKWDEIVAVKVEVFGMDSPTVGTAPLTIDSDAPILFVAMDLVKAIQTAYEEALLEAGEPILEHILQQMRSKLDKQGE